MHRYLLLLQSGGRALLLILLLGSAVGCASSPRAEFLRVSCDRVQRGRDLQAVSFTSSIRAQGLAGQQVLYRVGVVDSRLRPLKSTDGRFSNASGNVAASKALMVHESPWTFENVTVTIPAAELEINARDLPVLAQFTVCLPNGECLAQETTVVPVHHATHARRAEPTSKPGPRVAAKTRSPSTHASRKTRTSIAPPVARGTPAPVAESKRRPATSQPVVQATTRPSAGQATTDTTHPLDWWRTALAGAEAHAALAAAALFPYDAAFASSETADTNERNQQTPTSKSAPVESPQDAAENQLPIATSAPAPEPSETQPSQEEQPKHRRYVVQSGDTLWHIAERLLGNASRWHEILEINRDRLSSPHELRVGLELIIPPITEASPGDNGAR